MNASAESIWSAMNRTSDRLNVEEPIFLTNSKKERQYSKTIQKCSPSVNESCIRTM